MILILGEEKDALCGIVHRHLISSGKQTLFLNPRDLIKAEIIDRASTNNGHIVWCFNDGTTVSSEDISGVLNRCPQLTLNDVDDFIDEDKEYALAELQAYLVYSLSRFCGLFNSSFPTGIHGTHYSFTEQFHLADQCNLKTPEFIVTNKKENLSDFITKHDGRVILRESIYEYRAFRCSTNDEITNSSLKQDTPVYAVQRPNGNPTICHVVGNDYICRNLTGDGGSIALEHTDARKIIRLTKKMGLNFCELLLFVTEAGEVTVGYISPWPEIDHMGSSKKEVITLLATALCGDRNVN